MKRTVRQRQVLLPFLLLIALVTLASCAPPALQAPQAIPPGPPDAPRLIPLPQTTPDAPATAQPATGVIVLPEGFQIEKVVDGLTYPTSITWDDQGQMYVAEAGGGFLPEPPPARILRIENGQATEVVNLSAYRGLNASG